MHPPTFYVILHRILQYPLSVYSTVYGFIFTPFLHIEHNLFQDSRALSTFPNYWSFGSD